MAASRRPPARRAAPKGEVRVVAYDPAWVDAFGELLARLRTIQPRARIEHIGSTSVPGCEAKPIIDVSLGLAPGTRLRVDDARSIGLEFRSVSPESTHFVFRDEQGRHFAHVHVNPRDSAGELDLLRFRDYLRTRPDVVREYVRVKHRILASDHDGRRYTAAKGPFFRRPAPRILRWAKRAGWAPRGPRAPPTAARGGSRSR